MPRAKNRYWIYNWTDICQLYLLDNLLLNGLQWQCSLLLVLLVQSCGFLLVLKPVWAGHKRNLWTRLFDATWPFDRGYSTLFCAMMWVLSMKKHKNDKTCNYNTSILESLKKDDTFGKKKHEFWFDSCRSMFNSSSEVARLTMMMNNKLKYLTEDFMVEHGKTWRPWSRVPRPQSSPSTS